MPHSLHQKAASLFPGQGTYGKQLIDDSFSFFLSPEPPPINISSGKELLKKYFIYLFLERGKGRGKEGEKHQCVVASHMPPTGDLAYNPDMCPDWESNQLPFGLQAGTQSTEPHQPGQGFFF